MPKLTLATSKSESQTDDEVDTPLSFPVNTKVQYLENPMNKMVDSGLEPLGKLEHQWTQISRPLTKKSEAS
ncbi:hypothetical protein TNCV_3808111 [Trichonephila clavipes]|nr:hypothetical protein TNCV_3808111 [Trichonephila clavipes]